MTTKWYFRAQRNKTGNSYHLARSKGSLGGGTFDLLICVLMCCMSAAELEVVQSNFTSRRERTWTWHGIITIYAFYVPVECTHFDRFHSRDENKVWKPPGLPNRARVLSDHRKDTNMSKRDTLWHKTYPKKNFCWRRTFHFCRNISRLEFSKKGPKMCLNALSSAFVNERGEENIKSSSS